MRHGTAPIFLQQVGNAHLQAHQAVTKPPKPKSSADRTFFQSTKAHVPRAIYPICCKLTNHSQSVTHTGATLGSSTDMHQCPHLWLPFSGRWQWSPTIIRSLHPFLLPEAAVQSNAKSCMELTRTKEAAGGSSRVNHIFARNNLLETCEEENLIWLCIRVSRGDQMWSQAERLSWIIYGS